jgi:hypothetical protein
MRFAHSISTDGYSVTLVCTNESVRGRKKTFRSGASTRVREAASKKENENDESFPATVRREFPLLTAQTVPDVLRYLKEELGCEDVEKAQTRFVGGDPGKNVLLALVDEFRRKVRYTSGQRRRETDGGSHRRVVHARRGKPGKKTSRKPMPSSRMRRKETTRLYAAANISARDTNTLPGRTTRKQHTRRTPYMHAYARAAGLEAEMSRRHLTPRTADPMHLCKYFAFREACRGVFENTYTRPVFRALRFTAHTKRRKSVEAFAERILEKYGTPPSTSSHHHHHQSRHVVVMYGDWGRRPNLKHQAPSPGIGLRRILHGYLGRSGQKIVTITVRETFTSSYDPDTLAPASEARGTHCLLRQDETASVGGKPRKGVYWSRDVLGALNILRKGTYLLRHGTAHPVFGS